MAGSGHECASAHGRMKVADLVLSVSVRRSESHRIAASFKHQGPEAAARVPIKCGARSGGHAPHLAPLGLATCSEMPCIRLETDESRELSCHRDGDWARTLPTQPTPTLARDRLC